ncbi:hypothetical protein F4801DRAFT_547185 [Xylaria longipes]|nr:hypothetical protein F4801DRAFT_547185 [Xylaria longipes]
MICLRLLKSCWLAAARLTSCMFQSRWHVTTNKIFWMIPTHLRFSFETMSLSTRGKKYSRPNEADIFQNKEAGPSEA